MGLNEICVGKSYFNRGAGTTVRTVVAITTGFFGDSVDGETHYQYEGCGRFSKTGETKVYFKQTGLNRPETLGYLLLKSFAKWAGGEVVSRQYNPSHDFLP